MGEESGRRVRYGESFWRAHHEAWQRSALNQREYCQAHDLPLKAFGNWRAKFKAEPKPPPPKLLYRRGGLSHRLSHSLSHSVSHMTNVTDDGPEPGPVVQPPRDGHRRKFTAEDKRRILAEVERPGASVSEVARHHGIAVRVLFRWKQERAQPADPVFVSVEITDANTSPDRLQREVEHAP